MAATPRYHRVGARVLHAHDTTSEIIESPIIPRNGVVVLWGYGIVVSVAKGHLLVRDGVGNERRVGRFSRVNHGIKRLIVIGNDGMISLAALRWLSDQDAAFVMLERDGSVLITTGPIAATDARLRRAQACAENSGVAVPIARELIGQKLTGQENVARKSLTDSGTSDVIAQFRDRLQTAETTQEISFIRIREQPHIGPRGEIARSAFRKPIFPASRNIGARSDLDALRCRDRLAARRIRRTPF